MKDFRCPNCSSPDVAKVCGANYWCRYCGSRIIKPKKVSQTIEYQQPIAAYRPDPNDRSPGGSEVTTNRG